MGILPKLSVVKVGKGGKKKKKKKTIKRGNKSPKRLLIMSARIQAEEFIASLFGTMQNNLVKITI